MGNHADLVSVFLHVWPLTPALTRSESPSVAEGRLTAGPAVLVLRAAAEEVPRPLPHTRLS